MFKSNISIMATLLALLSSQANCAEDEPLYVIKGTVVEVTSPKAVKIRTESGKLFSVQLAWIETPERINPMGIELEHDNQLKALARKYKNAYAPVQASNYKNHYSNATTSGYSNKYNAAKPSPFSNVNGGIDPTHVVMQDGYEDALFLTSQSLNKAVECSVTTTRDNETIKCDLYDQDNNWYNAQLLLKGLAMLDISTSAPSELKVMEDNARDEKIGLWNSNFIRPSEWLKIKREEIEEQPFSD